MSFRSGASTLLKLESSNNVRVTHNTFDRGGAGEDSSKWLYIGGAASHHNRIDHNTFQNKTDPGNYLALDGSRPRSRSTTGSTTIRSWLSVRVLRMARRPCAWDEFVLLLSAYTTFEYNLFEACDGDPEWLSIKVSDVTVRYNTARASQGSLTLRHGNRNNVYGNVILGENKVGTGGIRMYGVDHEVFSNYIANTAGTSYESALSVDGGDAVPGGSPSAHHRVDNASVVYNTLVDNATGIVVGEHYKYAPTNLRLENNLLADSGDVRQVKPPAGGSLANNTVGTKSALGLAAIGQAWKLTAGSPEIDKAVGRFDFVTTDFEGAAAGRREGRRRGRARGLTVGPGPGPLRQDATDRRRWRSRGAGRCRARPGPARAACPSRGPAIAAMSASVSSKSNTSMFSPIRDGSSTSGSPRCPSCRCQRSTTCAGVRPCALRDLGDDRVVQQPRPGRAGSTPR